VTINEERPQRERSRKINKIIADEENSKQRNLKTKTFKIIPEIKHSTHYAEFNVGQGRNYTYFEDTVISIFESYGYSCKDYPYWLRDGPTFIQSFEVNNLVYLDSRCEYPLLQLMNETSDQVTHAGLVTIASYADAVGISKQYIKDHTNFTSQAHSVGLLVMIYTVRNAKEDPTIITDFGGDIQAEYMYYYNDGVDYIFSEKVDEAIASRQRYIIQQDQDVYSSDSNSWVSWQIATVAMAVILLIILLLLVYFLWHQPQQLLKQPQQPLISSREKNGQNGASRSLEIE